MATVVIVGGGIAGVSASAAAKKAGADVILIERTNTLLGAAIRAGGMNSNGRIVAVDELKEMGGGDIHEILESIILHKACLKGERGRYTYDASLCEPLTRKFLESSGIFLSLGTRAIEVKKEKDRIEAVILEDGKTVYGEAFVDATGSFGGVKNCSRYGKGCMMCVYHRCPVFGDRISIATKAGAKSYHQSRPDGTPGKLGASVCIYKESLSDELRERLEKRGIIQIPLPKNLIDYSCLDIIGAVRSRDEIEHINLVDIGPVAKCMALPYIPLERLRKFPGFECAQIEDPLGGSIYNMIHHLDIAPIDESLKVPEFKNLFCAGEKAGIPGVSEASLSGWLAGHNGARVAAGKEAITLPKPTLIGDFISYLVEKTEKDGEKREGISLSKGIYFERLKELGFYPATSIQIQQRIKREGLSDLFAKRII